MKAVLISIQPQWCEKISFGKKTVEVRKTKPKLETPFKCYIYCTKGNPKDPHQRLETHATDGKIHLANGKVIGEFVCDDITKILNRGSSFIAEDRSYYELQTMAMGSCLDFVDMKKYFGNKDGYAWHISDLVIYDKPKPLSNFIKCHYPWDCGVCDYYDSLDMSCNKPKRPPQSWCYVEG